MTPSRNPDETNKKITRYQPPESQSTVLSSLKIMTVIATMIMYSYNVAGLQ